MTETKKPRIAIQNIHKLPNLATMKIHNYALEMVRRGHIDCLYFGEVGMFSNLRQKMAVLNALRKKYKLSDFGLGKVKIIFSERSLRKNCDVLLNFNGLQPEEFTPAVKRFSGIKIFHVMDYFWAEPGSEKYKRLKAAGVDYLMSYGASDKHCAYFKATFPDYIGRVIPVAFGYSERFIDSDAFSSRVNKCVALGSVNPMRPYDAEPIQYQEPADFYKNEEWFHKFRRMIVENLDSIKDQIDSMLPVYPKYKDNRYDLVKKFNEYKMFTCDESLFYFPAAKTFEGPACGTVMVCSDHPCFADFGFRDGVNCITHKQFDIPDLAEKVRKYQNDPAALEKIQKAGSDFVKKNYNHAAIADSLALTFKKIWQKHAE